MSSCRKNSRLQNVYCKEVFIFLDIIIYLLQETLIFTSFNTPNAVHISKVQYTYTKTCQSSQRHIKCTFMPLNVLSNPILHLGSEIELYGPLGKTCKADEVQFKLFCFFIYLCNGVSKYQYNSSFLKKNFRDCKLEIKFVTGRRIKC